MTITVFYDGINPPVRIGGNPTLVSLDGSERAPLQTILHESWTPERRADFGIYLATTEAEPDVDPTTEKVVLNPVPVIDGLTITYGWTVKPLTQDEQQLVIDDQDRQAIKQDTQVLALLRARPDQINNYIDTNVTDLASARAALKILARATAVLAQSLFR